MVDLWMVWRGRSVAAGNTLFGDVARTLNGAYERKGTCNETAPETWSSLVIGVGSALIDG